MDSFFMLPTDFDLFTEYALIDSI